ncbi:MAG: hypothetical protein ABI673_00460 [Novosphingobium sp.]
MISTFTTAVALLAKAVAATRYRGAVAACGLAQGSDFPSTVMPFILRGVTLLGIDREAIRDFAKEQLASYKLPRRVLFFAGEELETTGTAKIKTAELSALAANRLAEPGR